jgi:hypothetical protein
MVQAKKAKSGRPRTVGFARSRAIISRRELSDSDFLFRRESLAGNSPLPPSGIDRIAASGGTHF